MCLQSSGNYQYNSQVVVATRLLDPFFIIITALESTEVEKYDVQSSKYDRKRGRIKAEKRVP